MERGCDTSQTEINMPNVELQARLKEQKAADKQAKLKYRGVTYLVKNKVYS
tara:strand:+ start:190 stop:342 length:153 start_codon:yes stop_codon:yes gene_type:complete